MFLIFLIFLIFFLDFFDFPLDFSNLKPTDFKRRKSKKSKKNQISPVSL